MSFLHTIQNDNSKIVVVLKHFDDEYIKAKSEVSLYGNLEKHSKELPGIVEYRYNQLQEIESILEYYHIDLRKMKAKYYKKYLEGYNKSLSSRDADKYIDAEDDVINAQLIINEISLVRNKFVGIIKSLEIKGFQLNNIIRIRSAGIEELTL